MTATATNYLGVLEEICSTAIAPHSDEVDRDGIFPHQAINALKNAGLLGAVSAPEVGGLGLGHRGAAAIVARVARECGSTAMVTTMHFSGTAVLEAFAPEHIRRSAASGEHLSTLAFSEATSRSQFWAPTGTAARENGSVILNAEKSWITSANQASSYVWSSRPVDAEGMSTLWLVPADTDGLAIQGTFNGLGLRGNDSSPVIATDVAVEPSAILGEDGGGFDSMIGIVLPMFCVCNAACSVGLMQAAVTRTAAHAAGTRYEHTGQSLADFATTRAHIARMKVLADSADVLLQDTVDALEHGREDAVLRVLECKTAASELSTQVLDLGMRVCGGSAFRREVGVERYFRDARAAGIMAPTTDTLLDFIGKAVCGMELFS